MACPDQSRFNIERRSHVTDSRMAEAVSCDSTCEELLGLKSGVHVDGTTYIDIN